MFVDDIPTELSSLEKLEQILIAQRIVFEKILSMPRAQQRKVKGGICNGNEKTFTENYVNQPDTNENNDVKETREDSLNQYRQASNETCLQHVLPDYPSPVKLHY